MNSWYDQLISVGYNSYSKNHQKILADLLAQGFPVEYMILTESAAEAVIQAVADMIIQNNKAILAELSQ